MAPVPLTLNRGCVWPGARGQRSHEVTALQELAAQSRTGTKAQERICVKGKSKRSREMKRGEGGQTGAPGWGLPGPQGDPDAGTQKDKRSRSCTRLQAVCCGDERSCRDSDAERVSPERSRGASVAGASSGGRRAGPAPSLEDGLAVCAVGHVPLTRTTSQCLHRHPSSAQLGASASRSPRRPGLRPQLRPDWGSICLQDRDRARAIGSIHLGNGWGQREVPEGSVLWSGLMVVEASVYCVLTCIPSYLLRSPPA